MLYTLSHIVPCSLHRSDFISTCCGISGHILIVAGDQLLLSSYHWLTALEAGVAPLTGISPIDYTWSVCSTTKSTCLP